MTNQVPVAAKIRFLQSQIDLTQRQMACFNLDGPEKYPGERDTYLGFQYQEEILMAILADYRQVEKEMTKNAPP